MRKKLFVTLLMIVSIILTGSAYKKASNGDAKDANYIYIVTQECTNRPESNDEMIIKISNYHFFEWASYELGISYNNKTVLYGVLALKNAEKRGSSLYFVLDGVNEQTKEHVEIILIADSHQTTLTIKTPENGTKLSLPSDIIYIRKDNPYTKIFFNGIGSRGMPGPFETSFTDPWTIGTTKQLKLCLAQNPYLRKK